MRTESLRDVDALVLCGGLGTRLRPLITDRPKALAEISGRPFIDILLDRIFAQGISRAVLCVGFEKEQIKDHITLARAQRPAWGEVVFSEEDAPLGTGGAIKNAEALVGGEHFFVLNGDTLAEVVLADLYGFHREKKSTVTIAAAPVPDRADVGSLDIRDDGRISGFRERAADRAGYVNAGAYMMHRSVFDIMPPEGEFSLEQDIFPKVVVTHPCFAFVTDASVLDIGTPERYRRANER
jgi:NDP-sugar pyrophosphorylase family protein